jgi:hypothetical protein
MNLSPPYQQQRLMICHEPQCLQNPLRLHAAIRPHTDWFGVAAE